MLSKRKIVIFITLVVLIIVTLSFVTYKRNREVCKSIEITILDSAKNKFVERDDILELLYKKKKKVLGYGIDSLNISEVEKILFNHSAIKHCEVYKTIDGVLNIEIEQRNPVVRIINSKNQSYYIDEDATIMSLSNKYTSRVIVANGNINEGVGIRNGQDIYSIDSTKMKRNLLREIYVLVSYIRSDKFLNAQIEQIYVNEEREFELVPMIGEHIIVFGTLDNYKEKFRNLLAFYQNGLYNIGWNKYKMINIKFKNQVVCTRK